MHRKQFLLLTTRLMSFTPHRIHIMEKVIPCSDGIQLAAIHWSHTAQPTTSPTNHHRILCLHGWLDNASSFHILAPTLLQQFLSSKPHTHVDIVALDHVGHGKSMHKSPDATFVYSELAYYVAETLKFLQWDNLSSSTSTTTTTTIIGHSMSSGVALLYSAAFPEQIDRLILLDGVGPLSRNSAHVAQHVRDSITKRLTSNPTLFPHFSPSQAVESVGGGKQQRRQRVYTNLDSAIDARMSVNYAFQQHFYMSREASHALVLRGTKRFLKDKVNVDEDMDTQSAVVFSHDQRLKWPSLQYFTRDQVVAMYQSVICPTCLLIAHDGWLMQNEEETVCIQGLVKNLSIARFPGSHHFHADPDTAMDVVQHILQFINEDAPTQG